MLSIAKKIQRFLVDEDGPAAVEYAIMITLVLLGCIYAVTTLGQNADTTFSTTATMVGNMPTGN